jgi:hypothetical protein
MVVMSDIEFNIELPGEWQDQTMYYFRGPEIEGFVPEITLNVDRFVQTDDINEYSRERISPIVQSMQGIEVMKDREITREGGNPAYEFVFRWIPADEVVEIHRYLYVMKADLGFTLLGRFSKKSYRVLKEQFREIADRLLPGTFSV